MLNPPGLSDEPVGRVARWQGQQRVAVVMEEIGTIVTAYIPNAFIEKI